MPVATPVAMPTSAAVPVVVKVFCEVLGLIFIVLVHLTLENIKLTLSYNLKHL
jgi:hypothetical protein